MNKIALNLSILFCLSFAGATIAETSYEPEEHERWYEVEIIVYKTTGNSGLLSESWKTDTPIVQPENLVDFLQPYEEVPLEQSVTQVGKATTVIKPGEKTQTLLKSTAERPFVLLSDDKLKLKSEAKSLSRHPDYRLLVHYGWRQPIYDSADSQTIRIAGGQDFSKEYLLDGSKIELESEFTAPDFDLSTNDSDSNLLDINSANATQVKSSIPSNLVNGSEQALSIAADQLPQKIALPWVPELDGNIRIYVNRYLHVKTDLFLRRPDREELEIIEIETSAEDNLATPIAADSFANVRSPTTTQAGTSLKQPLKSETQNQPTIEQTQKSKRQKKAQFSWEINDDFLESESQKIYIERLFNYELQQSRRLRSEELHLFDHPMLGVLIVIRPYEQNQFDSSVNSQVP